MNTRLQVEHGVTEEVTGVDLVQAQIRSAAGERARRHPAERANAATATRSRRASTPKTRSTSSRRPGKLDGVPAAGRPPACASRPAIAEGRDVTPHYDPMIAKVIVQRATRDDAIERSVEALRKRSQSEGVKNNIPALLAILDSEPSSAPATCTPGLDRRTAST